MELKRSNKQVLFPVLALKLEIQVWGLIFDAKQKAA
jgi:hypothetical protein